MFSNMRTKKLLLICSTFIVSLIVLSTLIYCMTSIILYGDKMHDGGSKLITFQLEIYVPIFTTWTGLFIYECWITHKRRVREFYEGKEK